jgi:hypothetical protein
MENFDAAVTRQNGNLTVITCDSGTLQFSNIYQVFDPLSPEEQQALYDDIRVRGIQVPIDLDQEGAILDGHNRVAIAKALGIPCPVIIHPYEREADKFEHTVKANLLRRQVSPIAWVRAMQRLLDAKGIARQTKWNRFTDRDDTLSGLYAEVGVTERTAQRRFALFDALKKYPDLVHQVDAGQITAAAAKREIRQRRGQDTVERSQKPGNIEDLSRAIQRCVEQYMTCHEDTVVRVHTYYGKIVIDMLRFPMTATDRTAPLLVGHEASEVVYDARVGYKHEHDAHCREDCNIKCVDELGEPIEPFTITKQELDTVFQYLLKRWRTDPHLSLHPGWLEEQAAFEEWGCYKIYKVFAALEEYRYFITLGSLTVDSMRRAGAITVLNSPEVIKYYRENLDSLIHGLATEKNVREKFSNGNVFHWTDIIAAYPATTAGEAKRIFKNLRKCDDIVEERQGRGGKIALRIAKKVGTDAE